MLPAVGRETGSRTTCTNLCLSRNSATTLAFARFASMPIFTRRDRRVLRQAHPAARAMSPPASRARRAHPASIAPLTPSPPPLRSNCAPQMFSDRRPLPRRRKDRSPQWSAGWAAYACHDFRESCGCVLLNFCVPSARGTNAGRINVAERSRQSKMYARSCFVRKNNLSSKNAAAR